MLVPAAAVGAVGVPENAGEAMFAGEYVRALVISEVVSVTAPVRLLKLETPLPPPPPPPEYPAAGW